MKKRSAQPRGDFHVQIVKGRRLSNDLANRLNDYRYQFPKRRMIAVNVLPPAASNLCDELHADDPPVLYEIVWEDSIEPPRRAGG